MKNDHIRIGHPVKGIIREIFLAINYGILGFSLYLLVIYLVKKIRYFFVAGDVVSIETGDIYLSLLGFVLFFLIKILNRKQNLH